MSTLFALRALKVAGKDSARDSQNDEFSECLRVGWLRNVEVETCLLASGGDLAWRHLSRNGNE
jgi:hypothetical protein